MKKELTRKIVFTVLYGLAVALLSKFGITCVFRQLLGVNCPGCGMTRACLAALRLDFRSAFHFHIMFWSCPILYLYFLFDGKLFGKKADTAILVFIGAGFFANWIYHLFVGF